MTTPKQHTCDHKFVDSNRCLKCGKPFAELKAELDRAYPGQGDELDAAVAPPTPSTRGEEELRAIGSKAYVERMNQVRDLQPGESFMEQSQRAYDRALYNLGSSDARARIEGENRELRRERDAALREITTWQLACAECESDILALSQIAAGEEPSTDTEGAIFHSALSTRIASTIKAAESARDAAVAKVEGLERERDHGGIIGDRALLFQQVALEALRLIYRDNSDRCAECGLLGAGALKDALVEALGPEPWKLIQGRDGDIDREAWKARLRPAPAVEPHSIEELGRRLKEDE